MGSWLPTLGIAGNGIKIDRWGGAYFQTIRRMWHRVKVIVQCNVIIKNGRVIDGSGAPSFNSKVGIRGGILVEVDKLNSEATQVINV